jgi:uncharacterized LabA/DUF88 family protein
MSTSVRVLVDGFNLYHSMREVRRKTGVECRWLDIRSLCRSMLHTIGGGAEIARIDYFSALAHHMEANRPGTVARHERYIDALRTTGVTPHLGVFKPKDIRYRSRTCEVLLRRHEEKETDVAIAAAIVETAAQRDCAALTLVSGDTDLLPALDAARRLRPELKLYCLFPPYRSNQAFRSHADALFKISPRNLPGHLLPDPVLAADGRRLAKPATW